MCRVLTFRTRAASSNPLRAPAVATITKPIPELRQLIEAHHNRVRNQSLIAEYHARLDRDDPADLNYDDLIALESIFEQLLRVRRARPIKMPPASAAKYLYETAFECGHWRNRK